MMIEMPLNYRGQIYVVILDEEDGDLTNLTWRLQKSKVGLYVLGSWSPNPNEKYKKIHRVVLERKLGRPLLKGEEPDHKDRNPLNNTRGNLRPASPSQNKANNTGKSGRDLPHGVNKMRKRYRASITLNNKYYVLGIFDTPEEAFEVFKRKHVEAHGEFSPYYEEMKQKERMK